ncbi:sigma-70, region 4 family protein [Mycobacterium xenopi 4042]|uniref:Sigma-70, region 4 family protein n=1 Tax=Mycobacterium xenopi 4042 TaxID=1299334 RepID=X8BFS5_MYCXE|nr:sigma-70, region 4 family protein [Mycobacterium xenopi 4042]
MLLADAVSRALVVVLDRLSPAQRVAFVLHDLFGLPFEAIGDLLDRSPTAAKKLASRARQRLHADPVAESPCTREHLQIVEAFLAASRGGDIPALLQLLARTSSAESTGSWFPTTFPPKYAALSKLPRKLDGSPTAPKSVWCCSSTQSPELRSHREHNCRPCYASELATMGASTPSTSSASPHGCAPPC